MSLLIKNIFTNAKFEYPAFVTATHAFVTASVGFVTSACRKGPSATFDGFPDAQTWLRGIIPVGIATGSSLGLANMGLWYSNAHFYEMLGASGFLTTAAVGVMLGIPFEWKLLSPMMALTSGALILSMGEINFSLIGAVCIISATFCRALKAQIQGILMSPNSGLKQLGPVENVTCTSLVSLAIMLLWSALSEGWKPWSQLWHTKVFLAVLIAALNAAVLNIASIFVIRSLGPVAQQCVGQLKSVLCCVGAVVAFNEAITYQQILGYSVVIASIFWYNHRDMKIKEQQKLKKAGEFTALNPSKEAKV
jgi:drug/metabolite transporter (DMT)-like permease